LGADAGLREGRLRDPAGSAAFNCDTIDFAPALTPHCGFLRRRFQSSSREERAVIHGGLILGRREDLRAVEM